MTYFLEEDELTAAFLGDDELTAVTVAPAPEAVPTAQPASPTADEWDEDEAIPGQLAVDAYGPRNA